MRGNRVNLKNVPIGAWIFATVGLVAILAAFVVVSVTGSDSTEIRWLILAILNGGAGIAGVANIVYSGAAARNSQTAAEQTNGSLDDRIQEGVRKALDVQRAADTEPGGELRR